MCIQRRELLGEAVGFCERCGHRADQANVAGTFSDGVQQCQRLEVLRHSVLQVNSAAPAVRIKDGIATRRLCVCCERCRVRQWPLTMDQPLGVATMPCDNPFSQETD